MKPLKKPLKDGELRISWGRMPGGYPELIYSCSDKDTMRQDVSFLCHRFSEKRPDIFANPVFSKMAPSFLEELEARGYDITTLKFSIMKRSLKKETKNV